MAKKFTQMTDPANKGQEFKKVSQLTINGTSYDVVDYALRNALTTDMADVAYSLGSIEDTVSGLTATVSMAQHNAEEAMNAAGRLASAYQFVGSVKDKDELDKITATDKYYKIGDDGTVEAQTTNGAGFKTLRTGDIINLLSDGMNYAWDGSAWDALGGSYSGTDTSGLATKQEAYKASVSVNSEDDGFYTLSMQPIAE